MIVANGLVAFSGENSFLRRDIRVTDGIITEIGANLAETGNSGEEIIDASDCWVLPGGIDPHVHFYDPGYTVKEDFAHGTIAAAAGGITTVIDMPCTSTPPVTNAESLAHKHQIVGPKASIDYGFFAGISRQIFDAGFPDSYRAAMASVAHDVMGYKAYAVSGMDDVWGAVDHWRFSRILQTAKELNSIVLLHAEDPGYVGTGTRREQQNGDSPQQWYDSRPELAEILAVQSARRIAQQTGGNLHIVHIGSADAAAMLEAPDSVCHVTGETCPHYLAFGLDDFLEQGATLKVAPSIKSGENRNRLWRMVNNATLSFIASDHAPGTPVEKSTDDVWQSSAGISGVQTILPYVFSAGLIDKRLSLSRYLAVMHENAAKRYGLFDRKGSIEPGKHADFAIIDAKEDWTVRAKLFHSKGKLSPYEGMRFHGTVTKTIVRGSVVYDRKKEIFGKPGWGVLLKPTEHGRCL